ncbi:hypothetical protein FB45DRAFT_907807 [Roridomyces roridus]|uniref:Uncharacterized protein n=1 Tax=Roridomyces roridus TaxID=1738132 RepID=A0AAD7FSP2_9AGAR|nr:hypothetical protein FB45DRAFT_907807 [Roridomyces roridus]
MPTASTTALFTTEPTDTGTPTSSHHVELSVLTRFLIESFLCGVYFTIFTAVMYMKFRRAPTAHSPHSLRRRGTLTGRARACSASMSCVIFALVVQFCLILTHLIGTTYESYVSLVRLGGEDSAAIFFSDISRPSSVLQISTFILSSLVTDMLVIHRLFVIWSRRLDVVIFPLLSLLGQAISGGGVIHLYVVPNSHNLTTLTLHDLSNGWGTCTLVLSIVISAYSTAFIAGRIWCIRRSVRELTSHAPEGSQLMTFLVIFVESAALQTALAISILVTFQRGVTAEGVLQPIAPVVFGLSSILIHARVSLGVAYQPTKETPIVFESPRFRDILSSWQKSTIGVHENG